MPVNHKKNLEIAPGYVAISYPYTRSNMDEESIFLWIISASCDPI